MDKKIDLLLRFYNNMLKDKLKLEHKAHGFAFIDQLTAKESTLDYVQVDTNLVHKYRLLGVTETHFLELLEGHVKQEHNICLYFNEQANNIFCFNLDNNYKIDSTCLIPSLTLAIKYLRQHLGKYAIEPLVIKSGRGFHCWCRLSHPLDNEMLFGFMIRIAAQTLVSLSYAGHDYHTIKFNMAPNPRVVKISSLRLFGSKHVKTDCFSQVNIPGGDLDEPQSWQYFAEYLANKTIPTEQLIQAYSELTKTIRISPSQTRYYS